MPWENNRPNHVPAQIRDQALKRDGYQCTAQLQTGGRCPETTNLEAAHITQWRDGEQTTVDMVRILCSWHHNRETQREAAQARAANRTNRPSATHPHEIHPALRPRH